MLHKKMSLFALRHSRSNLSQFLRTHPNGGPGGIEGVFSSIPHLVHGAPRKRKQRVELLGWERRPPSFLPEPTSGMHGVSCFSHRKATRHLWCLKRMETVTPWLPKGIRLEYPRSRLVAYRAFPISPPQSYQMSLATQRKHDALASERLRAQLARLFVSPLLLAKSTALIELGPFCTSQGFCKFDSLPARSQRERIVTGGHR